MVFLLLMSIASVYGQGKNFSIDRKEPSWIVIKDIKGATPAKKDIDDGYFLSFYESQNHVELQEEYTHVVREIVSDAGVQNGSQISATYDPGFQKIIFHKIILWRNNKPSDQLKASKFKVLQSEKSLSKFIYSGTYEAFLLVEDVRKGDRIEYSYTLKGNNPIFGQKFASQFYFESSSSIGHLYTNIIFNKNRRLQLKNFNFNEGPKKTEKDGLTLYEWESKLTKTHRVTDFEPSWYDPLRRTQVSEYANWNEVVNWGLAINDYPNLKSPLLDKKVAELKAKSGNDPKKYIVLATRFVQDEIRYMGIEVGQYSHKPNSPERVLAQRYGDCKDKSLLLVHLLEPVNIKAYMAYVSTYNTIKTGDYLPSPFVFNHVVVMVDYDNNKTWIDPTISYQRGKYDNMYFPDYGSALIIRKGVNALEKVISIPTGKQVATLTFDIPDTVADKKAKMTVRTVYTDNYADNMRSELAESGTDGLEKSYLEYYAKLYTDIEVAAPLVFKDNEETNTLEVTESYEISNIWEINEKNNTPYISFYADAISPEMRNIPAKNRTTPLSLKNPVNIEQTIIIHTPEIWNLETSPFKLENDDYYFEQYGIQKGKTLRLNYVFRNKKSFIEGSKAKAYIKDRQQIIDNLSYYINWGSENNQAVKPFNPYVICITIILFIVSGIYFINVYQKRSLFNIEELDKSESIKGWLILLVITAIYTPLELMGKSGLSGIWAFDTWKSLNLQSGIVEYSLKMLIIINAILFSILLCYSILGIILLFNRRKSFPRQYIIFLFGYICFLILNFGAFVFIKHINKELISWMKEIVGLTISIAICVAWISYLKRSIRVKKTFVYTYPEIEWTTALMKYYNEQAIQKQKENVDHENI